MDKQTDIRTNTQNMIPVNTRTIGTPEGIYILYLEDYVHTFLKKILSDASQGELPKNRRKKEEDQAYQQEYLIERTLPQKIALYGRSIEENGRYRIVVSGAAVSDGSSEKLLQLNNTYFPSSDYIGDAGVSLNRESRLRIELTLRSTKVVLDDFYIYYDQNEEMQNYLVEWNTSREGDKGKVVLAPAENASYARSHMTDAAQLGRITQAYNREEAKVSFMWNVMNVLCLGFVVCVMAYGIISMNNYNKMQNMQENIDYCMAFIEENTSFLMKGTGADTERSQPVSAIQQAVQAENEMAKQTIDTDAQTVTETEQAVQETSEMQALAQPVIQDPAQPQETPETAQALTQAAAEPDSQPAQPDSAQPDAEPDILSSGEQASTPQYYVVRRGDTLRTICYDIYGDYSRVDEICRRNNIDDPNNILYGQKLLLP